MKFNKEDAVKLLECADVFYLPDEDVPSSSRLLNMNDTWAWATAWGEEVSEDELPEVARLFWMYGWPGVLYWVSEKHGQMKSEFVDINRFVEFVRQEERLIKEIPDSNKRAYHKLRYSLGE